MSAIPTTFLGQEKEIEARAAEAVRGATDERDVVSRLELAFGKDCLVLVVAKTINGTQFKARFRPFVDACTEELLLTP